MSNKNGNVLVIGAFLVCLVFFLVGLVALAFPNDVPLFGEIIPTFAPILLGLSGLAMVVLVMAVWWSKTKSGYRGGSFKDEQRR